MLHRWSAKPYLYAPKLGRLLHRPVAWLEERHGRPLRVRARRGVVLAAGGFVANRPMMREHAPAYRGGLPLGTPGDDGSGIRLGAAAGGATAFLGRVSVWRFLSPPSALLSGVLVGRDGRRVCDESRYGAAIGAAMMARHGGQAWLLADRATLARARRQLRGPALWFQRLQGAYLLTAARVSAATAAAAAARAGVDPAGLAATLEAYNAAAAAGRPDPAGKPAGLVRRAGPAAVLAHRLLGPAPAGLPRAHADPRRACGRRGHRAGAPGRRHRGTRPVRGGPHRGRPVLALLRQRAVPGRLRVLRPPGRAQRRGRQPRRPAGDTA